ncbi:plasmid mobilization relaxosome protein MobC [Spirosoma soli]|uniref:Plasmid mobilization relaxosome protein MobC n=1 Tax=Spirosoma soli TaxID=1770529 RepID=A0ABW5MCA8_9BACT
MNPTEPLKKKGGRPPSQTKRDQQMTVCLTKLEKLAIQRRAQKAGLNLSDYGRQMVLTGKAQVRLSAEENATLNQVAKLGNNLNQLAHKANADGIRSIAFEAQRLLRQLSDLLDKPAAP